MSCTGPLKITLEIKRHYYIFLYITLLYIRYIYVFMNGIITQARMKWWLDGFTESRMMNEWMKMRLYKLKETQRCRLSSSV